MATFVLNRGGLILFNATAGSDDAKYGDFQCPMELEVELQEAP